MSVNLIVNGVTFSFPELSEKDWGLNVTAWATAITAGMLQKAGGTFSLTADADFGASYGLKSIYYKTRSSNIASAGQFRLARTDVISWRNQANGANLDLSVNSSNVLQFNGVTLITDISSKLDVSAFTDTAVTSKLITGYSSGAGVVAETDTILEAINKLSGNIGSASGNYQEVPRNCLVWKDANTVTVKAGVYHIGAGVWLTLVADLDWTFVASGQNRGLDTGSESSNWYYLYGVDYLGAFGVVGSLTAPTALHNTNLSGSSYDTNVYLGAIRNTGTLPYAIREFIQSGAEFMLYETISQQTTTNVAYQSKTLDVPESAAFAYVECRADDSADGNDYGCVSIDGSTDLLIVKAGSTLGINHYCKIPLPTAKTVWLKVVDADNIYIQSYGWTDKWL